MNALRIYKMSHVVHKMKFTTRSQWVISVGNIKS